MSHPADPTDTLSAIHRIKQEIDAMTAQQIDALKLATYLGMTPEEAQEYDERRKQITALVKELSLLEEAQ
jgi:hypothetical protein